MRRGEVWSVALDPTRGSEQQGSRPAVIISPDTMNDSLETKVIVPLTTKMKDWPSRVLTEFNFEKGQAMCEQIRTIDKSRLKEHSGSLSTIEIEQIKYTLRVLFTD